MTQFVKEPLLSQEDYLSGNPSDPNWVHPHDRPVAHLCRGKVMRPYASYYCNICMGDDAVDHGISDLVKAVNVLIESQKPK